MGDEDGQVDARQKRGRERESSVRKGDRQTDRQTERVGGKKKKKQKKTDTDEG